MSHQTADIVPAVATTSAGFRRHLEFQGAIVFSSRNARIAGLVLLALAGSACSKTKAPPPPPVATVRAVTVESVPAVALRRRGLASTASRRRLGFAMSGRLQSLPVRVGDRVKKGQLLGRLRSNEHAANLQAARAARALALAELRATARLEQSGTVAPIDHTRAQSRFDQSSAGEALAVEALTGSRLVSPVAGVVFQRLVEPGEVVAPGAPVVVIEDSSAPLVRVGVTASELARLHVGQATTVEADGLPPSTGRLATLSPSPDPADGLYSVEVETTAETAPLRSGTLVTVGFVDDHPVSRPHVPLEAVAHRRGKDFVFVLARSGGDSSIKMREVVVEAFEADDAVLSSGVQKGDLVVAEGVQFLLDDQVVRVLATEALARRAAP